MKRFLKLLLPAIVVLSTMPAHADSMEWWEDNGTTRRAVQPSKPLPVYISTSGSFSASTKTRVWDGTDVVDVTSAGEMEVSLTTALPAGTNAIGKLSANSGVDIGDVDVTSTVATTLTAFTSCAAPTDTAMSTSSETVFAALAARKEVVICNLDASIVIYVARAATATSAWDAVQPKSCWTHSPSDGRIYTGAITAIAASGTPSISGTECQ